MPNPVAKSLSRLSRERLIDLCVGWTKSSQCDPYLLSNRNLVESVEEDYLHEPAQSRRELAALYTSLKEQKLNDDIAHLTKKDIIDRIVDGDWRRGLSYHQLASIDFACLDEDDTCLRWSALRLVPLFEDQHTACHQTSHPAKRRRVEKPPPTQNQKSYPQITAEIFVQNLKSHISPLVKAYYHIHRLEALKTSVVRLHIQNNIPFAPLSNNVPRQGRSCVDTSRTIYIALPDSCPYVYISVAGQVSNSSGKGTKNAQKTSSKAATPAKIDVLALKRIVLEAVPKALSRPQQRWSIEPTKLTAKSLRTMLLLRGNGKAGTIGGSFSKLTESPNVCQHRRDNKNNRGINNNDDRSISEETTRLDDARTELIESRFGAMSGSSHASLDKVHIKVRNLIPSSTSQSKKRKRGGNKEGDGNVEDNDDEAQEPAPIIITLSGSDVFAGLKQFALSYPGYVDMAKLHSAFSGDGNRSHITL